MSDIRPYYRTGYTMMRPYVEGEDMTGISISESDTPEVGGMIAYNEKVDNDRWYVAKQWFEDNYEE